MAHRVFVVEDHVQFREMLVEFLDGIDNVAVCGYARNAAEALERLPGARPDLVLLDVSLPGMDGFDLAVAIGKGSPGLRCVMLSGHCAGHAVRKARALGLRGYVAKGDGEQLEKALREILAGGSYFPEFD